MLPHTLTPNELTAWPFQKSNDFLSEDWKDLSKEVDMRRHGEVDEVAVLLGDVAESKAVDTAGTPSGKPPGEPQVLVHFPLYQWGFRVPSIFRSH